MQKWPIRAEKEIMTFYIARNSRHVIEKKNEPSTFITLGFKVSADGKSKIVDYFFQNG